jgi:hypothetical protein
MLEAGADPNISYWPIVSAIAQAHLDVVKLLVEHGADYNMEFFQPPATPLSHAISFGHHEIVQYLKSLGARLPAGSEPSDVSGEDLADMSQRIPANDVDLNKEIKGYFEYCLDATPQQLGLQEFVAGKVNVAVWTVEPENDEDPKIIFTTGMSELPMTVPDGQEEYQYAELMMFLPCDWPVPPDLNHSAQSWPWLWLRKIAHYPHENDTWLGDRVTTFSNDDPPQPVDPSCGFTGFLLVTNQGGYVGFPSDTGRYINIINVVPVYTEECALAKTEDGIVELLERFQSHDIPAALRVNRRNVGLSS